MASYSKQEWINSPTQTTPINATRLNHIEDGIDNSYKFDKTGCKVITSATNIEDAIKELDTSNDAINSNLSKLNPLSSDYQMYDGVWCNYCDELCLFVQLFNATSYSSITTNGYGVVQNVSSLSDITIRNINVNGIWVKTESVSVSDGVGRAGYCGLKIIP